MSITPATTNGKTYSIPYCILEHFGDGLYAHYLGEEEAHCRRGANLDTPYYATEAIKR
jgi:hypothetical protein